MPAKRRVQKVIGRIDPDAMYTSEGCMRYAGIGYEQLTEARQAGVVTAYMCGRRAYFRGAELIEWILSGLNKPKTPKPRAVKGKAVSQ